MGSTCSYHSSSQKANNKNKKLNTCQTHENRKDVYCTSRSCGHVMCRKCFNDHIKINPTHDSFRPFSTNFSIVLDKYEFVKFLGSGSFGKVFEIKYSDGKNRALKWIDLKLVYDEYLKDAPDEEQKRILEEGKNEAEKEFKLLRPLNHDYILTIIDYAWISGTDLIMILELGKSDITNICKSEKYSREKMAEWFLQICQAVKYLHKNNVIHRDLKTANILLTEDEHMLVCDFGGAQAKFGSFLNRNMEATLFGGTENYLAPEIRYEPEKVFTYQTDVWALGIIYHKMLAKGKTPLDHEMVKISNSIQNEFDIQLIKWYIFI